MNTKQCQRCREVKPVSEFTRNYRICSYCNACKERRTKDREERGVNRATPQQMQASAYNQHRKYQVFMEQLKNKPCADCGQSYPPYVMEFHHPDPSIKTSEVATLRNRHAEFHIIEREAEKCILLCANCHRVRTYKERHSIWREQIHQLPLDKPQS